MNHNKGTCDKANGKQQFLSSHNHCTGSSASIFTVHQNIRGEIHKTEDVIAKEKKV